MCSVPMRQGGRVVRFKTGGHWASVHFKLTLGVAKGEQGVYKRLEMKGGRERVVEFDQAERWRW